ncbi:MAG: response regulator, partial [Synechococcales cyanobacterium RU_4_20]|nr:response regulator [Synechococcales cyanobacterium RU_4_20]
AGGRQRRGGGFLLGSVAAGLVLMDMRMPVLDGYEATRQIRELEALRSLPPTPIIATSAGVLPEELEAALKAGCTTTLPKPFQQSEVLHAIHTEIGRRQ